MKQIKETIKELNVELAKAAAKPDNLEEVQRIATLLSEQTTNLELAKELRRVENAEKPRVPFVGVYHNNGDNAEEKPYRAALCINSVLHISL